MNSTINNSAVSKGVIALSEATERRLQEVIALYPQPRSAIMSALWLAQDEIGYLSDEAIDWVADRLKLPPVHVLEVATFYTMYFRQKKGKYHVQICRTLSCALRGSVELTKCIAEKLGTEPREITADGKWSFEEVECLGSCGTAPICQINDRYFENLTPEKLLELMTKIEHEQPDLSFQTKTNTIGDGLKQYPMSVLAAAKIEAGKAK